ncbi:MAG: hypothetical protein RhofKO_27040 [Rhodothermales bacterium]
MSHFPRSWRACSALILLLTVTLVGCDVTNIADDIEDALKLIINVPEAAVSVSGAFVDAKTNEVLASDVSVRFEGPDAARIVDPIFYEAIGEATVEGGFVQFALEEGLIPSPDQPVRINVIAEADGYLTTGKALRLDSTGVHIFTLNMVKISAPPEGVAIVVDQPISSTDDDGRVTEAVTVSTPPEANTQGVASVSLPAGTQVKDSSGQPLQGPLTATIAYHNNQDMESLESFPGGFSEIQLENADGSTDENVAFITGGFVSVDIRDQAGRLAETFSEPIQISVSIPQGTLNPETGAEVKPGDTIPVWSYNEDTGAWKEEGAAQFGKNGVGSGYRVGEPDAYGNLPVVFEAPHLSYWNLDWKMNRVCGLPRGLDLKIEGNPGRLPLTLRFIPTGQYAGGFISTRHIGGDLEPFIYNFPEDVPTFLVIAYHLGREVGRVEVANPCGASAVLNVSFGPRVVINVVYNVFINIDCGDRELRPSQAFQFREVGSVAWANGFMRNGEYIGRNLVLGGTYQVFFTYFDRELGIFRNYESFVTVEGDPVDGVVSVRPAFDQTDVDTVCRKIG